jgi:hypothetical protein
MLKKGFFYFCLVGIVAFMSSGFKNGKFDKYDWFHIDSNKITNYSLPSLENKDYINRKVPFTGNFFIGYKEAIAFRESQGKYSKINSIGYMGKYQFGSETLRTIGIYDRFTFLNSPRLQEKAFVALLSKNKWELRKEIEKYEGQIVGGVRVTESGLLAAAHLGGVGSVKRFLRTNGYRKCRDINGTSVKSYMREFGGYETSGIKAKRKPKVK